MNKWLVNGVSYEWFKHLEVCAYAHIAMVGATFITRRDFTEFNLVMVMQIGTICGWRSSI